MKQQSAHKHLAAEAADWYARLREPGVRPEDHDLFSQWLLRSPAHIHEYLAVSCAASELEAAPEEEFSIEELTRAARADTQAPNVVALCRPAGVDRVEVAPRAPRARRWMALAAGAAAISAGLIGWGVVGGGGKTRLSTEVGEQRSITLRDGSIVHLNTDSQVRIEVTEALRRITLVHGEARFTVARDPSRPFVVNTGDATVRALGTVFNVRASAAGTAVAVLEGRVEVATASGGAGEGKRPGSAHPRRLELAAGQRAAVDTARNIVPDSGPPLEQVREWTERRLVFREETLVDLVAEVNRYHSGHLRIDDPAVGQVRVSGSFAANDLASLLEYLHRYENIRARTEGDGSRVLFR